MNITYDGKTYKSIMEFSEEYGLRYSTTVAQLKQGIPPDKVIERQKIHQNRTYSPQSPVTYKGVTYPSLAAAAMAFEIAPPYIYNLKRKNHCSSEEALKTAIAGKKKAISKGGNQKECIVDGVVYSSKNEAIKAYDTLYVTVKSRMLREGISFEEALIKGNQERHRLKPTEPVFKEGDSLKSVRNLNWEEYNEKYQQIYDKLISMKYNPKFYSVNKVDESLVLALPEKFLNNKYAANCYVSLAPYTTELVIPNLITDALYDLISDKKAFINTVNASYCGIKVYLSKDSENKIVICSESVRSRKNELNIQNTTASLLAFLGNTECIVQAIELNTF